MADEGWIHPGQTAGARGSSQLLFAALAPQPFVQTSGCWHKCVQAASLSQPSLVWARIIGTAKENETGEERDVKTKEVVLWDWGKEMLKEK